MSTPLPIFAIADTLQIRLGKDVRGKIRGHKRMELKAGGWDLPTDVQVEHDFQNTASAGAWVKIRKHLWGYITNIKGELRLTLFDASIADLKTADIQRFATGTAATSFAQIYKASVASFIFEQEKWVPCDFPNHLLKRGSKGHPESTGGSPQE